MPRARASRPRGRTERSQETRRRILAAVHDLLAEGTFHESSVEQVADRAGVSRATLYQHFPSRLDLVDAICDTFAVNPALLAVRASVTLDDPTEAIAETVANSVRFWSSEDAVLKELYGAAAVDPAASDFVDRQRSDRRSEVERLARHLERASALAPSVSRPQAAARLMMVTSYESYRELRLAGLTDRETARTLQESARALVLR